VLHVNPSFIIAADALLNELPTGTRARIAALSASTSSDPVRLHAASAATIATTIIRGISIWDL
jgi:hypothetical protein